jgi:hypothetical protein
MGSRFENSELKTGLTLFAIGVALLWLRFTL